MSLETPIPDATADTIFLPEQCLLLLVGPAGVGKSTFARKHFKPTEILSSDFFRGMICDDESHQGASRDAFEVLHLLASHRLAWGRFTVIDATNLQAEARQPLLELARRHHIQTAALVFLLPLQLVQQRNLQRQERIVPEIVVASQWEKLTNILAALNQEKVGKVFVLDSPETIESLRIVRYPLRVNLRHATGPLD